MNSRPVPSAVKVGALVVVASALMYAALHFLGGHFLKHGQTFYVSMSDAGGMGKGTRVSMAGVRIGEVEDVKLENPHLVLIELDIMDDVHIPAGSTAEIPSSFISIGDAGLTIKPPKDIIANLPVGSTLQGSHPSAIGSLAGEGTMEELNKAIKDFDKLLVTSRGVLEDPDLKGGLKELVATTASTLKKFEALAGRTNQILAQHQGQISDALDNITAATADVRRGADLAVKLIQDGHYQEQATAILKQLNAAGDKANKLLADVDHLVDDPAVHDSLKTTLQNAASVSETGKAVAENARQITANGVEASKQVVIIANKASEVTDKAGKLADEASNLVKKLENLTDKVAGRVDRVGKIGGGKPLVGALQPEVDFFRETKPNYNRADVNLTTSLFGQDVRLGIYDFGARNGLNLQLGKSFAPNAEFWYGLHDGTEGVGVDYRLAPRVALTTDIFGLNNPRFDAYAKFDLGSGFVSWFGLERIFNRNEFAVGVGFQK
jgi:ABC-type transporter Mla subunit MlaD